jgi:outer membrane protein assembly factor BamB
MTGRRLATLVGIAALVLLAGGCDWTMFGFDAGHSHNNTTENAISTSNVSTLVPLFTGQTGGAVDSSPAVVNGVVYVGSGDHKSVGLDCGVVPGDCELYAFDANGATNCSGTPNKCSPLWTALTGAGIASSPAVVNGVVYVNSEDHLLYAFDANGATNCSGTPKTCSPLWTAPSNGQLSSPTVANGVVYSGGSTVSAFDAKGMTNCSGAPKVCKPLWTSSSTPGFSSSPAVANGVVYASGVDDRLYGFDANGATNCSGTPKTCSPLWTATLGTTTSDSSPAVVGGVVYVGSNDSKLYAFDAKGNTNCSGVPKTCGPLWTAATPNPFNFSSPAVASGVVYAGSSDLEAFDANGNTNCSGTPKTCTPLWVANVAVLESSPSVANGLVFIGSANSSVEAFDATGTTDCSGTPKQCNPLWTGVTGSPVLSDPAIANGKVYAGDGAFPFGTDNKLFAFKLP